MIQKLNPYIRTLPGDTETPITLYQKFVGSDIGFLLESKEQPKGRYSFVGKNPTGIIRTQKNTIILQENGKTMERKGAKALDLVKEYIHQFKVSNEKELPFVGGAVGTVAYDIIRQYEKLPDINPDSLELPQVHLMVVKQLIAYDHLHHQIMLIVLEEKNEEEKAKIKLDLMENEIKKDVLMESVTKSTNTGKVQSNITKEKYMDNVRKAKKYIYEGDIFQVVLSQRWTLDTEEKPFMLYRRLRQVNPSPYLFYLNFGEYQVAGSSPEMLVEVKQNKIYTCPIAGTRKRGKTPREDKILAEDLRKDPKEQAEHVMLVDLGRNDMGKVAKIGSVNVKRFMEVQNYSHVMHLVSLVEGERQKNDDMFSILASFLPAGTLSGAPKIRAMEIIEELEEEKRGIYGGSVGYFGFDGNMDMCIAIRTMIIKDGKVYMQAGAGIVADSDPESEFEETQNKIKALLLAIRSSKGGE